jgi:uncharacterized protein (DUF1810 family)
MPTVPNLQRFLDAQRADYSEMAHRYGITGAAEAAAYLAHPVLGQRLLEISRALLALPGSNATAVMGSPDDLKLRSSMTLFAQVPGADAVFQAVLDKFFGGQPDTKTLQLLGR